VVVPGIANQSGTSNVVAARAEGTGIGNQARCYNCKGLGHITRNCTARPRRKDVAYLQTQLLLAQKEEAKIQLQAEEFDFMAAAGDLNEIEEVKANFILMANLPQASTSGTQHDKAPVYDTDGSAENDNHVASVAPSMVQSGGTVETSFAPNEKTCAHQETVYRNLVDQVPTTHKDQSSSSTHPQQSFPISNKYSPQPSLNQKFMQPPMTSLEDINDPTEATNAALILFAKAFQLSAPTNNNQRTSSNPRNRQHAQPVMDMG
nr:hypothetical protein [Tanacetum cinerariifolium]